ncbi:MAG: translocation/assembly module TamB domain-containing protein [Paludibacteraceae bacterium]
MLKNSKIQNYIAQQAVVQLSEKLNTNVSIGEVNYKFFNRFSFEDLYVEDLHHDTLLYVDKAYAHFNLFQFFKGKFLFNKVELDKVYAHLVIDTTGKSNLDFIIQAFKNPEKYKTPSKMVFNFNSVRIVDSRFRFTNLKHTARKDSSLFDGNRMFFSNINGNIGIDYFKGDSLSARIKSLSFAERSGLQVKNIETSLNGFRTGFSTPQLTLSLPNSTLALDSVHLSYDSIACLKDIMNKVRWNGKINSSTIMLSDLSPFIPNLKNIHQSALIKGKIKGLISSFSVKGLELKYGKSLVLQTDIDLNGIPDVDETFVYADVKKLEVNKNEVQDLVAHLTNRPFILPQELSRLGMVKYTGNISGFFGNLVAYGNIATNTGNLNTDILLQFENNLRDLRYNGTLRSNNFEFGTLLNSNLLGKVSFSITTKGTKLYRQPFQGTVKGNVAKLFFNKYNYQKIVLNGSYDESGFDGKVNIDDPNLLAEFNGVVELSKKKLPIFNFDLTVTNADVNALRLTRKYTNSHLSFSGNTNMIGNSLDNLNGFFALNNIRFVNGDKTVSLEQLMFESEVGNHKSKFTVSSDLVNGIFEGDFKYSTLPQTIKALIENYIPALSGNGSPDQSVKGGNNFMNIDLTLADTKKISDVLELPFAIDGNTLVQGYVDDRNQKVELTVKMPFISFKERKIQDIDISLNNLNHKLNLIGKADFHFKNELINLNLKVAAENDSLYTQLGWINTSTTDYAGEIQAVTKFEKIEDLTSAQINILPTQVIISDTIWNMLPSRIDINSDTTFTVHNFKFQNGNQYITLNGLISKKETEALHVEMNKLQIGYILDLVNLKSITIDGRSTGTANLYSVLKKPVFETDLYVQDAKLNNALIGNALVHSTWNREKEWLAASGKFFNNKGDTLAYADGIYVPKNDSLDFLFNAKKLNLAFLQRYLSSVVSNVQGAGAGKVRMYGNTKNIGFEGSVFAEKTRATVDYLKTTYSFSDTVYMTRKSVVFKNITLFDDDKNTGILNGNITHNGNFKKMLFDVKVNTRNLMALNTKSKDNDFFYGKAYASGNVHIYGNEDDIYFDINVSSRPGTKFNLSIGNAETANDNDFITFVNRTAKPEEVSKKSTIEEKSSNIYLNMELDVTPDADIQLIIDPKGGDHISAVGSGNLRLTYDPNNDMRLYGGYRIDKGNYLFTLQNVIRKDFKIDQGSSITWSGDPFHALLDIRAIYTLTASLRDLNDETLMASTSRSSVPVSVNLGAVRILSCFLINLSNT